MKYTRDQFKTAAYLLWEKGTLRQPMENDKVYIVKYRTSDDGQYSRVTVKAESVMDALQQACYVVANEVEILPENVDVHSVYDSQGKLLWGDKLPYVIANSKSDENGMSRREFLSAFGLANAALFFGLPKISKAATTSVSLTGTASGLNYVDDVFNAYLYTGNGSTQNITNGIDLAGHGGLVWIKSRSGTYSTGHNCLQDTARGATNDLFTNLSGGQATGSNRLTAFSSTGFSTGLNSDVNDASTNYLSWTFRKSAKFFDIVTYTGNGGTKIVPHSLGAAPGMIIIKRTDAAGDWPVYHHSVPANCGLLNLTNSFASAQRLSNITSTDFTINVSTADCNANAGTYVAYIFANDTASDGIIQCGSFTASLGSATINLGWEPQFVLLKQTNGADNWYITDSIREFLAPPLSATQKTLKANLSNAEAADGLSAIAATSTGFYAQNVATSGSYIYVAIRRPNKPPTTGAQVFEVLSTNKAQVSSIVSGSIVPDLAWFHPMIGSTGNHHFYDRLRGSDVALYSNTTSAEAGIAGTVCVFGATQAGLKWGDFNTYYNGMTHLFRRTPGVFDIVADTGTGSARQISHSLGVPPEFIIRKSRSNAYNWNVYCAAAGGYLVLNLTNAQGAGFGLWTNGTVNMNATTFSVSSSAEINSSADKFISYLFATKTGISKVGSYTGNGTSQTVNCTFTTGARFVLIKRTDGTGDWYVWDTVRGIVANNDQHLSLNTTAAEVATDDSIDTDSSGFIVNQVGATNINTSGATYIFLAIS